ncbi:MAG TPA: hypothetical protein VFQ53_40545 [Kofleriaceae bacterium]|nr:hypothetical protein [Kofleriaceae bacterium]
MIIVVLLAIAFLTLGGMAFMMTVDAFGIIPAIAAVAGLGLFGGALWVMPSGTIATLAFIGGLTLIGLAVSMIVGAIIGKRSGVSSWPAQQEASFQPFEQRGQASHSSAMLAGIVTFAVVFLFAVGVKFGVKPEIRDISKSMNMSNLTKKSQSKSTDEKKEEAPAPKKEEAPAPKTDTAPAGSSTEAPADKK